MTTQIPSHVALYNADFRALRTVSWQEAVGLIMREAVYVLENHSPSVHIHSPSVTVELPVAVALREYVYLPHRPRFVTREGVLRRDRHVCAYCGGKGDTIDHVLPRSRGGADAWTNLVAACGPCNTRKSNRLPHEAGMTLRWEPYEPNEKEFYYVPSDETVTLSEVG